MNNESGPRPRVVLIPELVILCLNLFEKVGPVSDASLSSAFGVQTQPQVSLPVGIITASSAPSSIRFERSPLNSQEVNQGIQRLQE